MFEKLTSLFDHKEPILEEPIIVRDGMGSSANTNPKMPPRTLEGIRPHNLSAPEMQRSTTPLSEDPVAAAEASIKEDVPVQIQQRNMDSSVQVSQERAPENESVTTLKSNMTMPQNPTTAQGGLNRRGHMMRPLQKVEVREEIPQNTGGGATDSMSREEIIPPEPLLPKVSEDVVKKPMPEKILNLRKFDTIQGRRGMAGRNTEPAISLADLKKRKEVQSIESASGINAMDTKRDEEKEVATEPSATVGVNEIEETLSMMKGIANGSAPVDSSQEDRSAATLGHDSVTLTEDSTELPKQEKVSVPIMDVEEKMIDKDETISTIPEVTDTKRIETEEVIDEREAEQAEVESFDEAATQVGERSTENEEKKDEPPFASKVEVGNVVQFPTTTFSQENSTGDITGVRASMREAEESTAPMKESIILPVEFMRSLRQAVENSGAEIDEDALSEVLKAKMRSTLELNTICGDARMEDGTLLATFLEQLLEGQRARQELSAAIAKHQNAHTGANVKRAA